jgi:hypothetical protein
MYYAECHSAECHSAECHYAECHKAEYHYDECCYLNCRGAVAATNLLHVSMLAQFVATTIYKRKCFISMATSREYLLKGKAQYRSPP